MKKKAIQLALSVLGKKRQHTLVCRALNYLASGTKIENTNPLNISICLKNTNINWVINFDGAKFTPSNIENFVKITIDLNDIIDYPSISEIQQKIIENEITVSGEDSNKIALVEIIGSIDQLKVNACSRYLRKMVKIREVRIEDKDIRSLTLRDALSASDINYLRDQAIKYENSDAGLAYHLMKMAHTLRPHGPFIKRKLNTYRQLGYDYLDQTNQDRKLKGIEVVKGELSYFPVPKTACSSAKLAIYKAMFNNDFVASKEKHIHDYWFMRQKPIERCKRRVIIVRDPVERFLSAYANRVLDHGELNRRAIENNCPWLLDSIPHFKPTLNQFLAHIDTYMLVPTIEHHCMPLAWQVHHSLESFTDIVTMNNIKEFEGLLEVTMDKAIELPRSHVGKNRISLAEISKENLSQIISYYKDDYQLLNKWYSISAIENKWNNKNKKILNKDVIT